MIDRLRQIAIFSKIIDHGSFRSAAKELRLSPSVVSHHLSQLEEHLGVTLLYRSTRRLKITAEGERLLAASRELLQTIDRELQDISRSAQSPSGLLRMTLPSVLSHSVFVSLIAEFRKAYPRIQLVLDYTDTQKNLIEDGYDLAVRMTTKARKSPNLRLLFEVERLTVASASYVAGRPWPKTPMDTLDCDWLVLTPAQNAGIGFTDESGLNFKLKPEWNLQSDDARALHQLVLAGLGVATLPDFLVRQDITDGHLVNLFPNHSSERLYTLAEWPKNAQKNGLIELFVDLCLRHLRDQARPLRSHLEKA